MTARTVGRDPVFFGWSVYRVVNGLEVQTDPGGAWYRNGRKTFSASVDGGRMAALAQAQAWIAERFNERGPWKRNRMGDYVPARIADAFPLRRSR
jgi:hypothetical protein